jgi:sigma-B regulation protein RsbU (phosphoserine phosphatase)
MEPGDTLVLYSDGVTEAEDHHGQPFEEAGLESAVEANVHAKPTALAQAILKAVEHHARQTSLADDLTVLVVARKMSPPDTAPPPPDRSPAPPCAD